MTQPASLPPAYAWLAEETGPPMLREMLRLYGLLEAPGEADNPTIIGWVAEIAAVSPIKAKGMRDYKRDSQPWCGLIMALVAHRAGHDDFPDFPLWALNWSGFGVRGDKPGIGDVLTFKRHDKAGKLVGGHVGLYVGEDPTHLHVLGGNQQDSVNVMRLERSRLHRARRPIGEKPAKTMQLASSGEVSTNEA